MQEGATATEHVPLAEVEVPRETREGQKKEEAELLNDVKADKEEMKEHWKGQKCFPGYGWMSLIVGFCSVLLNGCCFKHYKAVLSGCFWPVMSVFGGVESHPHVNFEEMAIKKSLAKCSL